MHTFDAIVSMYVIIAVGTDQYNASILIRSKMLSNLPITDQSASSTDIACPAPITTAFTIPRGTAPKVIWSQGQCYVGVR